LLDLTLEEELAYRLTSRCVSNSVITHIEIGGASWLNDPEAAAEGCVTMQ
jgi:hypothetical protein